MRIIHDPDSACGQNTAFFRIDQTCCRLIQPFRLPPTNQSPSRYRRPSELCTIEKLLREGRQQEKEKADPYDRLATR